MRYEKRRHAVIGVEGQRDTVCSDEASGGWGLFDPRIWYRGTAAAKAVCCGSAIRGTGFELTVNCRICELSLCATLRQLYLGVTDRVDALVKTTRSESFQGFFMGLFFRR